MEFLKNIKTDFTKNLVNVLGTRYKKKIVIIESDDWGTIRMNSNKVYEALFKKGYSVDQCAYNRNDALESNEDLELLFEILNSIKGSDGKPVILTANNIIGNPDFEKIKSSNFEKYFYETFDKTLDKYPKHNRVIDLYKEGIENKVIQMQFHGREHVHVNNWMRDLQIGDKYAREIFEYDMFSVFKGYGSSCNSEYLNAMASYNEEDYNLISESIREGLNLFKDIWGFKSKTVIAPCYTWNENIEKIFYEKGITQIQCARVQHKPTTIEGNNLIVRKFMGQKNSLRQTYTIRNVIFEPSTKLNYDWVNSAMAEINTAFLWKKPAIISSHRLNYIGWINPANREQNLIMLKKLLIQITKKWPDVIFISSDQLSSISNN
ncbi:MAG: polysaccharide (de)acetylase [Flavobacterium sp.]|nr:polysaccharide (de)acetylase [Flavobacterium sp.]